MAKYIANAFSLQMIDEYPVAILVTEITGDEFRAQYDTATSVIGHADTAAVLALPCNRVSIKLHGGDVLYVAQLQGGRLPEGSTTLPEGFLFKYLRVKLF